MPSRLIASAITASVGIVLPMFRACIIDSATRRMRGRLSHSPSGTPTRIASPPEIATSFMCCCDRKMMSDRYLKIWSTIPLRCVAMPSANVAINATISKALPDVSERIVRCLCGVNRRSRSASVEFRRGAVRLPQQPGDALLRDETDINALAVDARQPAQVVHEHERYGRTQIVLGPDRRGQRCQVLAYRAGLAPGRLERDVGLRPPASVDDDDDRMPVLAHQRRRAVEPVLCDDARRHPVDRRFDLHQPQPLQRAVRADEVGDEIVARMRKDRVRAVELLELTGP